MHKMIFPFQSCNSFSKCSFREFRPFSVIGENHWPYGYITGTPPHAYITTTCSERLTHTPHHNKPHHTNTTHTQPHTHTHTHTETDRLMLKDPWPPSVRGPSL